MRRLYPRTKWSDEANSTAQLCHVFTEADEVIRAFNTEGEGRIDEEIADLEHSIQTYWDCRECEGADVEAIRASVIEKNRRRGYYPED